MKKPDCYNCKYRRSIPGDAHSKCVHPDNQEMSNPATVLISMLTGQSPENKLNVKGNEHGIKCGWFMFPYNYDPTWLESCDGFEEKDK